MHTDATFATSKAAIPSTAPRDNFLPLILTSGFGIHNKT